MQTATARTKGKKAFVPFSNPISEIHLVPLDLIDTAAQIRTEFPQESIEELAKDIEARGLLQPVLLNPDGGRFRLIAGERRLRAIKFNGGAAIPALLVKASADEAMLMQLAENIQREDLSLEEECQAIAKLYKMLGSLDKVAEAVKKSKPWCSKRYAMTVDNLHYAATSLIEDGITEDLEIIKAFSALCMIDPYYPWITTKQDIAAGKIGRDEIRAELKKAKEKAKQKKAANQAEPVSHAKPLEKLLEEEYSPKSWTLNEALEDINDALTSQYTDKTALDLYHSWTADQQAEFLRNLQGAHCLGKTDEGFKIILRSTMHGNYDTPFIDMEIAAMIYGHGGNDFDLLQFLEQLQIPKEKP
jgi:ParB/RepB/Spo0J family partition protein